MKKLLLKRYRNAIPTITAELLDMWDRAGPVYFQQRLREELCKGLTTKDQAQNVAFFAILLMEKLSNGPTKIEKEKETRG